MFRAIWLTTQNEARLLVKDPIVLFMLLFAPVVIITVAGYSLGSLYGGSANSFRLPLVNLDHGKVAEGIIEALRKEHGVNLEMLDDPDEARRLVSRRDRTPIAMVIPAGTSSGGRRGRPASADSFRRSRQASRGQRARASYRRVVPKSHRTSENGGAIANRVFRSGSGAHAPGRYRIRRETRDRGRSRNCECLRSVRPRIRRYVSPDWHDAGNRADALR